MILLLEILSYGCTTLVVIIETIDRFVDLGATTANEVGLVFLFLTIGSTTIGGLLSLIQALQLVKAIYESLKNLRENNKRVHPIALSEPQPLHTCLTPATETKLEGNAIGSNESCLKSKPSSIINIKDSSEDDKMFAALGKLTAPVFEKRAKDKQLLEDLREWWNSNRSALNIDAGDLILKAEGDFAKDSTPKLLERVKKSYYKNETHITRKAKA